MSVAFRRKEVAAFYLFLAPWLVGFFLFYLGPMTAAFVLSFFHYNIVEAPLFTGFRNYISILTSDSVFRKSVLITLYYAAGSVAMTLICSLALALLMNLRVPGIVVSRTLFYLPSVIAGVAISLLWMQLFNKEYGVINWFIELFGLRGPAWFDRIISLFV